MSGLPRKFLVLGALAGLTALHACHHDESQAAAAPATAPAPAPMPGAPSGSEPDPVAAAPAAPAFHEETFDLVLRPVGSYAAGKEGSAEVEVVAKSGYHPNDKYPYKFKVAESPGVKFAAPVFTKEAVRLEEKRAVMKLDFTPETKGPKTIGGLFAFSLCSAERCLVEKRDLTLPIAVD